jgi:peptide/nickel transport system substrate-binding protein
MFSKHQAGEYVEFVRNEDYYGYQPSIQKIRFSIIKDHDTAFQKLQQGEIDIIPQMSETIYYKLTAKKNGLFTKEKVKIPVEVYPRALYHHIKWNNSHVIFQSKRVRQAMTYALDRPGILKDIFMNLGTLTIADIPPDFNYYNRNLKIYPYDLKLASDLLDQEEWRDQDGDKIREKFIKGKKVQFSFTLYYPKRKDDSLVKMYLKYTEDLQKIGVKMTAQEIEWDEVLKRYDTKEFEAIYGGWLTDIPLVDFSQVWHSKFANQLYSCNQIYFKNAEIDSICQKMRESTVLEERIKHAYRVQEILHEEQPYTFLFFVKGVAAFHPKVQNRIIRKIRPYILVHPYYLKD